MESKDLYNQFKEKMHRIADIRFASAVLQWDQETYLPPKGAPHRGQQISTLSEMSHGLFSEKELGDIINQLLEKDELTAIDKRNVFRTSEDYKKNKKYSSQFVRALSEQVNKTYHSWIRARKENSFAVYEKDLDALIQLKIQEAHILGYSDHPYNALLDEFEKGATVQLIDTTFNNLLPQLKELYNKIIALPPANGAFLQQHFPREQQWKWGLYLIKELGYDMEAGRQDISEHPFSISFGPKDVRVTTRIDENDFSNMTWSCIHEAGHALYEQGLPEDQYGLPMGEACSYSIHESQSRLWENSVGRSLPFWKHYFPILQSYFPDQLKNIEVKEFYKAINKVQPSLIRTEADEISYHFHVYIRYELEKKLLDGTLKTRDIPSYWNEQYKTLLGVDVPDDKRGCLQDVHWGHGSFGYFPTYSLGSFYAAQFFAKAKEEIQDLNVQIGNGKFDVLLQWLREKIHSNGRYYTSEELCKEVTGEGLNVSYFTNYLVEKYSVMYKL